MSKIAFIDLEFHKKTKSSDFFKEILKNREVDYYWEDPENISNKSYLKDNYNTYIYWQYLPDIGDLIKIKDKNILLIPMYDGVPLYKSYRELFKIFPIKILCFSKKMYNFFYGEGFDCLYIQYFPKPLVYSINYKKIKIFFRYRGSICRKDVKNILGDQEISLTIKNNPDPGYEKLIIDQEDIKKYNIHFLDTFFDTHEKYYEYLSQHNVFIAPRQKEGIGMSFLESMSIGQCVIGYDESTMNEYIMNGVNGYLTHFAKKIDLLKYRDIGAVCKKDYEEKYNNRLKNMLSIDVFIDGTYIAIKKYSYITLLIWLLISYSIKIRRSILKYI